MFYQIQHLFGGLGISWDKYNSLLSSLAAPGSHLARKLHGCPLGRRGVRESGFHQTVAVGARETEGGHLGGRQTSRGPGPGFLAICL